MGRRDPSSDPFGATFSRKREKEGEWRGGLRVIRYRLGRS